MTNGRLVLVADDYSPFLAKPGAIYKYIGTTASMDLRIQNYRDAANWTEVSLMDLGVTNFADTTLWVRCRLAESWHDKLPQYIHLARSRRFCHGTSNRSRHDLGSGLFGIGLWWHCLCILVVVRRPSIPSATTTRAYVQNSTMNISGDLTMARRLRRRRPARQVLQT